jgi:uncharacterized repeat protein (TIGR02543 family)
MEHLKKIFGLLLLLTVGFFLTESKTFAAPDLIESLEGAAIRTEGVQGLRFSARVLNAEQISEKGFYILYGQATVIDLQAALDNAVGDTILHKGKEVYKVPVPGITTENKFSIVLTGIPVKGYLDDVTVIPYVVREGTTTVSFVNPIRKSVGEVAILMDQATQDPLPQGVEDVLSELSNFRRVGMVGVNLEVAKGVKDITDNYVDLNVYDFYPPEVTSTYLPIPAEQVDQLFLGYKHGDIVYNIDESFIFPIDNVLLSLTWDEVVYSPGNSYIQDFATIGGTNSSSYDTTITNSVDLNGFTWNLKGRNDQTLDGKAWTFGNAADNSVIQVEATGGIQSFSLDVVKAFGNTNPRTLELFVNDVSFGTFDVDVNSNTPQKWEIDDINVPGDVTIKVISINTGSRGATTADNFSWTSYSNVNNAGKVKAAKDNLTIGYNGSDNENSVRQNVILPTTGSNGTNVVWYSSDESVINPNNGVVTRPTTTGDVVVTLTALISLPEYEGKITKTFNLTVKTLVKYTVTFNSDGGSVVSPQQIEKGELATKPANPTRSGYYFSHWKLNGVPFNFNTPINSDITLVAHWETEPDYVTVTFNSNGGSSVSPQTIVKGGQATEPANPTKSGYAFDGWYEDASFNYLFNFSSALYANTTLHAKWSEQTLMPYYSSVEGLSGSALQSGLRAIISSYRHRSYDAAKYVLPVSDQDPNNSSKVILVYNRASVNSTWDNGNTWNREHVWPQSLLAGASDSDLHNLKPCNNPINSSRGNSPFAPGSGSYGHVSGGWYPGDQDKGDIARIIFFMITRYSQLNVNTMGSLSMFKQWHIEDPVDDFERNRNEVLYQEQENRNPFIDHPEFVSLIWGSAQASYTVASDNEIITNVNYVEVLISYYKTQSKYVKREEPHLFYS